LKKYVRNDARGFPRGEDGHGETVGRSSSKGPFRIMPPLPPQMPQFKMLHTQFIKFGFGPAPGHGVPFLFLILLAVVVVGVVALLTRGSSPRVIASTAAPINDAVRILDERFARGDVDVEDYKVRRELLVNRS
jgi:uncharacterized membrane protein